MKIVIINGTNYAATGNIVLKIAEEARKRKHEVFTCCKNSRENKKRNYQNQIYIGYRYERIISEELACITGIDWTFNFFGTIKFLNQLKRIKPDLINLHVIHSTYINVPMLIKYINKNNIPVVWTFHDSWAITGSCVEFERVNCFEWKKQCDKCPLVGGYPKSYFFDTAKIMLRKKKNLFSKIKNMSIITPSNWLMKYVEQSYLNSNNLKVINNGIDLNIYKPINSDIRKKYNIENKFVVLGVANGWVESKGIKDFIELSKKLPNKYQIVLVGTSEEIDKTLPSNIISIHKTYNVEELVKIYSTTDVFVNTTKDDNFPTVNIEALACGTPVITYNVGGSPEIIDELCGNSIKVNDIESLYNEIISVCENSRYKKENCIKRAKKYDSKDRFSDYVDLFEAKYIK